ncbi:MAG: hypothetical protein ACXVBQ_15490, partial [Pseudobdellovibrionaceae bacterium]
MRSLLIFTLFTFLACAAKTRQPDALADNPGGLELEQALQQGAAPTLGFLKEHISLKSFEGLNSRDPAVHIPKSLKAEKTVQVSKEKNLQQMYIRKF